MTTILVVDDEPDLEALVLQRFRRQIRAGNLAFLFARDGVEALDLVVRHPRIDLALADLNMPRMDGLTLLGRLQEVEDPLATVIVSAYGDMANIRAAMNRGAFDFLTKPIDFADLEATVAKTLRHVTVLREARARRAAAERAHAALARYFSPNRVAELAAESGAPSLASQRRDVTAVFTDITGFTALVETVEPTVLTDLLNGYFAGMTDIVFAHGGTITKIMGDALQVLFGAPDDEPDHAGRAVACAVALDTFAEGFRSRWRAETILLGATRIGLHSGAALVGDFGGGRYFDYTAYGITINTAARLEAANKVLGTRVCASAAVATRVPGFRGRPAGDLLLRGRSEPLRAYEPLSPEGSEDSATGAYAAAFQKLAAGDPSALSAFAALVGTDATDTLASFHLRRLLNGQTGTKVSLQ
ncbi:adenylate/guanylate cyclase domain-containing response regulator [Dankookia rubra]|uniref:Adenylate/guanylate cyclase domain-containing response regulator n=1 Tax=Dankookia rubra TaxID=1442381 RepID=A0A4R5Q8M1_9PROT|nr:adenylate/guanylate cyclase domain-containing protein [Dankookia rubra]TDH59116.1 adenylate/guanylate cyclase domain-containing response regulator [Dankookia rubra]